MRMTYATTNRGAGRVAMAMQAERGEEAPLRAPHYTASASALLGELKLAEGGVIYLEHLAEFRRSSIEALAEAIKGHDVDVLAIDTACACGMIQCSCTRRQTDRHAERVMRNWRILAAASEGVEVME